MVPLEILDYVWPALLVLMYVLVTCVLSVLASYFRHAIRVHELVCESKRKRIAYLRSLEEHDEDDVEVEEQFDAEPHRQAA